MERGRWPHMIDRCSWARRCRSSLWHFFFSVSIFFKLKLKSGPDQADPEPTILSSFLVNLLFEHKCSSFFGLLQSTYSSLRHLTCINFIDGSKSLFTISITQHRGPENADSNPVDFFFFFLSYEPYNLLCQRYPCEIIKQSFNMIHSLLWQPIPPVRHYRTQLWLRPRKERQRRVRA